LFLKERRSLLMQKEYEDKEGEAPSFQNRKICSLRGLAESIGVSL
jgi:hypothetical protein